MSDNVSRSLDYVNNDVCTLSKRNSIIIISLFQCRPSTLFHVHVHRLDHSEVRYRPYQPLI